MVRLPIVNQDDGTWGDILRDFIMKEHLNDDNISTPANGGHHKITIAPGTASAGTAPITFTTGTLLTTPEAGAMEFAGDHYYLTTASGTRKRIATYDESTPGATGDLYYRNSAGYFTRLPIGSANEVLTVSGGLPTWQAPTGSDTFSDADFTLQNDATPTKQLQFDLDSITAGQTRTLTVPDADTTLVGTDTAQMLRNKTIDGGDNTLQNVPQSAITNLTSDLAGKAASSHTHTASNISNSTTVGRAVLTAADAAAARSAIGAGTSNLTLGTTAGTAAAGNDSRLSDQRVPTDSSVTNAKVASNANIAISKLGTGRVEGVVNGTATNTTIWRGTQAQYNAIGTKDSNTIYFVKD